jgi:hypothetical protein
LTSPSARIEARIMAALSDINSDPVAHTWTYTLNEPA